jgi:hypothetical protein
LPSVAFRAEVGAQPRLSAAAMWARNEVNARRVDGSKTLSRRRRAQRSPTVKPTLVTAFLASVVLASTSLAAEVDQREANQQARINQGVRSGELTPGETARLQNREGRINNEIARDRAANGGHLTPGERARVNRQQDRASAAIARDKHNGRVR